MSRGESSTFKVEIEGVDATLRLLTRSRADLLGMDQHAVRAANSHIRFAAKQMGERLASTYVRPWVAAGPAPQSKAMSATVRPKSDRVITIRVGATNPRLSGFRRGNPRHRGSLAWGVEKGRYPGSRDLYRLPRSTRGYVIGPRLGQLAAVAAPDYRDMVDGIFKAHFGKAAT